MARRERPSRSAFGWLDPPVQLSACFSKRWIVGSITAGNRAVIQLPDIRQQTDYDCGAVCCHIVWQHYGMPRRRVASTQIDGTDPRTLEAALRVSGLPVLSGEMTLADLSHFTRTRPVIVLAKTTTDPATGHYMVCAGQRDRRLYFQCPSRGPVVETPRRFDRRWHDVDRHGVTFRRWGIVVGQVDQRR